MVKITVQPRSSKKPAIVIDFPGRHSDKVTVQELKGSIEAKFPKVRTPQHLAQERAKPVPNAFFSFLPRQLTSTRQRLTTTSKTVLADDDQTLGSYGVTDEDIVQLKDLGRQISWRTVFLIEYVRAFSPFFLI